MRAWMKLAVAGVPLLTVVACNRRVLGTFFDLPRPPAATPAIAAADTVRTGRPLPSSLDAPALPPPAFEKTLTADTALAMLPRDHAGNVDWVAAVRQGVIRPRSTLPGRPAPDSTGFRFLFDFFFPGPDTTFDAYFPHSTHTEWIGCQQCHARIFAYRGASIKMLDILQGKYCAECHGKVSYPVATACERCHTRLQGMPPNRAKAELLGTVTLVRVQGDSAKGVEGNAGTVKTDDFPRAVFPHWVHRSRYRCKACHMEVFQPQAGANRITMKDIAEGRACGVCHDGRTAFAAQFGACERCHIPPRPAAVVEKPGP